LRMLHIGMAGMNVMHVAVARLTAASKALAVCLGLALSLAP
jgi:hypothetical protein